MYRFHQYLRAFGPYRLTLLILKSLVVHSTLKVTSSAFSLLLDITFLISQIAKESLLVSARLSSGLALYLVGLIGTSPIFLP